jgi:hypothetical protein
MASFINEKYEEIGRRIREIPIDEHIISHEWEELVYKLCAFEDPALQSVGKRELEVLLLGKTKYPKLKNS